MIKDITNRIMPAMGMSFIYLFKFTVIQIYAKGFINCLSLNHRDTEAKSFTENLFESSDYC